MEPFEQRLQMANRLSAISQEIGFTLWQIQELEYVLAHYYVLLTRASKGMGIEAGEALVADAQSMTFGKVLSKAIKAGLLNPELEGRFKNLVDERNWLVHKSRLSSRNAVHSEESMNNLITRLNNIATESLTLMKHLSDFLEEYVKSKGVSESEIKAEATRILKKWHASD